MNGPDDLRSKPPCREGDALVVLTRLREAGQVAYFAGGSVRDSLLGFAHKDYDIATDAQPGRVRELFADTQAVGAALG
jgi:tRNA nucleotidyltransferase/poly(A) polymerase